MKLKPIDLPLQQGPLYLILSLLFIFAPALDAAYPDRPIKVIVPTDPGGSMDVVARTIGRAIEENQLLSTRMVIVNQPGAGGTMGTRRIRDSKADGYTIGLWHQGLVTSKAMQIVDYDHESFSIIGSSGYSEVGMGTGPRSGFTQYADLVERSKEKPIKFATNIGLPVHIVPMIFSQEMELDFQFIQVGGGSQRLSSIIGGHTELAIFSTLDFSNFKEAGIRPILFFTEERVAAYPDVPTTQELGLDFHFNTLYIWLAPQGLPETIKDQLAEALQKAVETKPVREYLASLGLVSHFQTGSEIEPALNDIQERALPMMELMRKR